MALSRISQAKNRMEGPDSLRGGWNLREEQIAKIYERYLRRPQGRQRARFRRPAAEDRRAVRDRPNRSASSTRTSSSTSWSTSTRTPTGRSTCSIRRLAEVHRNLAVVGDPDQSIYKWRGADLRNILDFEHDFPEAQIVRLEQNYRSTQVILDAASAVISQNRNRKDKRLWTDRQGGDEIVYFRGNDELEEADFITRVDQAGRAPRTSRPRSPCSIAPTRSRARLKTR